MTGFFMVILPRQATQHSREAAARHHISPAPGRTAAALRPPACGRNHPADGAGSINGYRERPHVWVARACLPSPWQAPRKARMTICKPVLSVRPQFFQSRLFFSRLRSAPAASAIPHNGAIRCVCPFLPPHPSTPVPVKQMPCPCNHRPQGLFVSSPQGHAANPAYQPPYAA